MSMPDHVEFYLDDRLIARLDSEMQPLVGDIVSIRGVSYKVFSRKYNVELLDDLMNRHIVLGIGLDYL